MAVQREILRRFREARRPQPPVPEAGGRTVGELLSTWNRQTQEKQRRAAEKKAREKARKEKAAAAARQTYLDGLAQRAPQAWQQVEALIQTRQPKRYDEAAQLLRDLCDLADRQDKTAEARAHLQALRDAHANKPSLLRRLDEAGLFS
jgi:FtsZ-interacting cell division protein YlmF